MLDKNKKILIVGLGLIGGSYAQGLTNKGYKVAGLARRKETIEYALSYNYIVEGQTEVSADFINKFDIIIFSLYPTILLEWLKKYHTYFKKGAIITDVSGVKGAIVYKINDIIKKDGVEFIAAHPMAGKEVSGIENADANIFKKANYIYTPYNNSKEAIDVAISIAQTLEFKNIMQLSIEEHDEMIAFLSQLTHCIAIALMNSKDSKELSKYTGDSFRDLTRIAHINENMWAELFLLNKKELLKQMDLFINELYKIRNAIENDDSEKLKEMMKLSTLRRSYFD